jgi:hypothetical protein
MNPTVKKPDAPKTSAIKPRPLKPTALALKNLVADWRRLALGVSGVAFATVLMFMQNGFRNALLDSPVQLLQKLDCDLIGISIARFSLPTDQTFPASLVERSLSNAMVQHLSLNQVGSTMNRSSRNYPSCTPPAPPCLIKAQGRRTDSRFMILNN